jgi:hypothetical protein
VAAVVLAGIAIAFRVGWFTPQTSTRQPELTQLTANPAADPIFVAAISPDGKYLAYSDLVGLHLRLVDTGETQSFPAPPGLCFR